MIPVLVLVPLAWCPACDSEMPTDHHCHKEPPVTLSVYLAAPYSAREVVAAYAEELRTVGYRVTARWLTGKHEADEGDTPTPEQQHTWAMDDLADIDKADTLVAFTAGAITPLLDILDPIFGTSGGRHVELGYAIARTKRVLLVGSPENVFHHLEPITRVDGWHQAVTMLASWLVEHERQKPRIVEAVNG